MATFEVISERNAGVKRLGINWFRVRNLLVFLAVFLVCLVVGVGVSFLWPVNYTSRVLVSAPHAGLQGDLNRAADLIAANAGLLDNAGQLDALLRISPEDMLTEFGVVFASSDSLRNFYIDGELYQLDGFAEADLSLQFLRAAGRFVDSFTMSQTSVAGVDALQLEFTDKRAETAAELINNFVSYSADRAVANLRKAQLEKAVLVVQQLEDYLGLEEQRLAGLDLTKRTGGDRLAAISKMVRQLEDLPLDTRRVRPVRLISKATAELARPTPPPWLIIAAAALIGLVLSSLMLLLLEKRDHEEKA